MKTAQVFVSHTSDMAMFPAGRSYVQAVLDAVSRAAMAPVDMRYFAARDGRQADYCRRRVRECEIYVAVVGFRYGSMVAGETVSYTELEFVEAGAAGLPRLVFLLDETVVPPAGLADADRAVVAGFRQRLCDAGLLVRWFTSDAGLELEVFHALTEVNASRPAAVPAADSDPAGATAGTTPATASRATAISPGTTPAAATDPTGITPGSTPATVGQATATPGTTPAASQAATAATQVAGSAPGAVSARAVAEAAGGQPGMAPAAAASEAAHRATETVPRQLPAAVLHFAGRSAELAALSGLVRRRARAPGTVVISAIGGTAGVGKTALAVVWAHRMAGRFPDGQLYVNLRGFDPAGQVMDPAEAVRAFLDALDVPPQRIPAGLDAQAALYRSVLAGRRMLIVLDNARDAAQVRPLLPGAPGCLVLVTSRNQLTGLVAADGAQPIDLDLLTPTEARDMLARRLGSGRLNAEPHATDEIIARCARLPLALAIAAARAATNPALPLHTLAEELRSTRDRLDALTSGDDQATDVRAVFSWSYRTLSPEGARLFRLIGLHPGPDISAPAAASLTDLPAPRARTLLAELTRANLIVEHTPGRYAFHDLLRAYAVELAHTTEPDDQRRAAIHRVLDHYLHTAYTAALLLDPHRDPVALTPPRPGVTPETPAGHGQALAWFTAEHAVLLAAIDHAADAGLDTCTWQLAWTLAEFLYRQGHWHDWVTTQRAALAAARQLADPQAQALTHRLLASAYTQLGRFDDARTHLRHALNLYCQIGDQVGQARTHHDLAYGWERQGRHADALGHSRQALGLYQAADHRQGQANALNNVGWHHALLGDHQQALTACQQALTLHQELGNRYGQATTWDSLGYAHHHLGDHQQAIACYQQALALFRDLGDRYYEATILTHLGDAQHATGSDGTARDAWRHAAIILDDLGHPDAGQARAKIAVLDTPPGAPKG